MKTMQLVNNFILMINVIIILKGFAWALFTYV